MSEQKICAVCNIKKPLSEFYFRKDRNIYRPNCKRCKPLRRIKDIMQDVANRTTKICKHCGVDKPIEEYQKVGKGRWIQPYCKPCDAERKRKYAESNRSKVISSKKRYYNDNKSAVLKKQREYNADNKEIKKIRAKKYRQENIDEIKKRQKEYSLKNKEIISKKIKEKRKLNAAFYKAKSKIVRDSRTIEQVEAKKKYDREYKIKNKEKYNLWKENNKDKIREQRRLWGNKKAATDIQYRLKRNIRTRIRCALKPNNAYKVDTSEKLLGCSIEFYRGYLEGLFTEGMTWEKFMQAEIEIDHKMPCKYFDLTKEEQQRQCFHYSNTQPLWAIDNMRKGAKIIDICQQKTA